MIFTTTDQLFSTLLSKLPKDKDKPIRVSSYGFYLGITQYGNDRELIYPGLARKFANALLERNHMILIGFPYYIECLHTCREYNEYYKRLKERYFLTKKCLGLNVRFVNQLHMKYYSVGSFLVTGGFNLSSSGFMDLAVTIPAASKPKLDGLFDAEWNNAEHDSKD